jgi:hypothetical protein
MLLYHGTTEEVARKALTQGLIPRGSRKGNWEHSCPSREDLVYLTRSYAPYFAFNATPEEEGIDNSKWGIVEIDTDWLEEYNLVPDEDFLEQASRNMQLPPEDEIDNSDFAGLQLCETMEERTAWWRDNIDMFAHLWEKSIEGLGNCAFMGEIPSVAVSRVVIYDPKTNPHMTTLCLDPMISLMNYAICGNKYRGATDWFFGEAVDPMVMFGLGFGRYNKEDVANNPGLANLIESERKRLEGIEEVLANRKGIELIVNERPEMGGLNV